MTIPPLAAETLFTIGKFPITNSYVNSTVALIILVVVSFLIKTNLKTVPGRFQCAVELILENLLSFFDQVTNDREKSKRFLPLVGTLFIFILISNWMGLLPGTGSIGVWEMHGDEIELIPLLRPAMSDLNLTLAMALVSIVVSHLLGIVTLGFFVHWNKFIQLGTFWKAVKTFNPLKILIAMVEFVVGIIEFFSEIAKVISLSLRLFGNIFAGEVLITVISSLIAFVAPLPFMILEIIVGIVQATVFSLLTLVYLSIATTAPHHDEEEHADSYAAAH